MENVGDREVYSFTYRFSSYHQVKITEEEKHRTTFMIEWGSFAYIVMPFILNNAQIVFSRVVVAVFKDFIDNFLEVYLDDWIVLIILK